MPADMKALRDQPFDLLLAMDARLRGSRTTVAAVEQTWVGLRFSVAGHWLLAPQDNVREILTLPNYSRIPNARSWMLGLANVRGSLLPIVDLRALLLGEPGEIKDNSRVLVLESDDVPAGFLVDNVAGFGSFSPQEQRHDKVATDAPEPLLEFLLGAFVRDGETLFVFSLAKLANSTIFQQAAA